MQKVFANRQVAHLWANRSQDEARSANGNFFFTGSRLYSYGSHFIVAEHLDNRRVLINDATYGQTTSMHQSHMRHALTLRQWETALHVPVWNDGYSRNLSLVKSAGMGKRLPDIAVYCAEAIEETISGMAALRYGYGPMRAAWEKAKSLFETGAAFCEYVAHGKRMPRFPVAPLPDELPSAADMPAFIRSYSKAKLLRDYAANVASAETEIAKITDDVNSPYDARNYGIQNYLGRINTIARALQAAARDYKLANGRESAKVAKIVRAFQPIDTRAQEIVSRYQEDQARAAIKSAAREAYSMLRNRANRSNEFEPTRNTRYSNAGSRALSYAANKFKSAFENLPADEQKPFAALQARLTRVYDAQSADDCKAGAVRDFETAQSYLPHHTGDAMRLFNQAYRNAEHAEQIYNRMGDTRHLQGLFDLRAEALAQVIRIRTELVEKNKTAVADWMAGTRDYLPHDAGTYARIKGDAVQTSRGASVPIEHACRLARIARRVIAAGGKAWADGTGPMVGGFRVNRIGADGSATIGCHEFDGIEGMRLLDVLEACPACAKVAASVESV